MSEILDSPVSTQKRAYKRKRVDSNGKALRRVTLMVTEADYGKVRTAVTCVSLSIFSKLFNGEQVDTNGPEDEVYGRAIAKICDSWIASYSSDTK